MTSTRHKKLSKTIGAVGAALIFAATLCHANPGPACAPDFYVCQIDQSWECCHEGPPVPAIACASGYESCNKNGDIDCCANSARTGIETTVESAPADLEEGCPYEGGWADCMAHHDLHCSACGW